jgi:predicted aminopeptidase
MLFHELAHQVVYVDDDTTFNESFATTVERLGAARWLQQAGADARAEHAALDGRRSDFRALTRRYRDRLDAVYRGAGTIEDKRAGKAALMAELRAEYARLKEDRWGGFAGYDDWFARANNAALGVQAAYDELVPGFERLFAQEGRDFERFYAQVRRLAALPKDERRATLRAEPVMHRN